MLEWFENFQQMDDKQIVRFIKKQGGPVLTLDEMKQLRKLLKNASITWGIYGIPNDVQQQAIHILGEKRFRQLKELIGI
jgi:hypothetical protein